MLESFVGRRRRDHLGRRVSVVSRWCLGGVSELSRRSHRNVSEVSEARRRARIEKPISSDCLSRPYLSVEIMFAPAGRLRQGSQKVSG